MYLWAIFLTSVHNTVSVRCLRKTKCTRKFVNKKKATQIYFSSLTNMNYPHPPESSEQFAFVMLRQSTVHLPFVERTVRAYPNHFHSLFLFPACFCLAFWQGGRHISCFLGVCFNLCVPVAVIIFKYILKKNKQNKFIVSRKETF